MGLLNCSRDIYLMNREEAKGVKEDKKERR